MFNIQYIGILNRILEDLNDFTHTLSNLQNICTYYDKLLNDVFMYTLFFYKNIFYKNIEAEFCEILRIF